MSPEIENGLFALGGAAIGALATLFSTRGQVEKLKLRVRFGDVHGLFAALKNSRIDVKLQIEGKNVQDLQKQTVWISNTGNRPLKELTVPFRLAFKRGLFECFSEKTRNKNIPQILIEKDAETRDIIVRTDFLNPGETCVVDFMFDDPMENRLICDFRKAGVAFSQTSGEEKKQTMLDLASIVLPDFGSQLLKITLRLFAKG